MQQAKEFHRAVLSPAPVFPDIRQQSQTLPEIFQEITGCKNIEARFVCFQEYLPVLIEQAHTLEAQDRIGWLFLLRDLLIRDLTVGAADLCLASDLLMLWADWPLACFINEILVEQRGENIDKARLAYAYWASGRTPAAIALCRQILARDPHCAEAVNLLPQMEQWLNYSQALLGDNERFIDADSGLYLCLLGLQHCQDFAWQYDDPSIAELCCLPTFESGQQWRDWLYSEQSLSDQLTFAIFHVAHGFIGSINLVMHDGIAFCYYWLGRDFRCAGLGQAALSLLLRTAQQKWAVRCCYAKVFSHNLPSRKLLERVDFSHIENIVNADNPNEIFYRWSGAGDKPNIDKEFIVSELRQLLADMRLDIVLSVDC